MVLLLIGKVSIQPIPESTMTKMSPCSSMFLDLFFDVSLFSDVILVHAVLDMSASGAKGYCKDFDQLAKSICT